MSLNFRTEKILKFIVGLILVPLGSLVLIAFLRESVQMDWTGRYPLFFLFGVLLYGVVHWKIRRWRTFTILPHEIAHALAVLLTGGRVRSFRVSENSGSVEGSKSNFFTILFPYIFPFYFFLVLLAHAILRRLLGGDFLQGPFYLAAGFFFVQHLFSQFELLAEGQSDIEKEGAIFSFGFLLIGNAILCTLLFAWFFRDFSLTSVLHRVLFQVLG